MKYPRHQFSKDLHYYQTSYDYCSICATSANSGTSGITTYKYNDVIGNLQNLDNNFVGKYSVSNLLPVIYTY